jgi:hypothetical protein
MNWKDSGMAIVRKFTIGVLPFAKMFRVHGQGGSATDAVLSLRSKSLPDDFFSEVSFNAERTLYRLSSSDLLNSLHITEESITFTKDYYEADTSFDFRKMLDEFRTIWGALNPVLNVRDVRRLGMVAEYQYTVDARSPSGWLRGKFTTLKTPLLTEKFNMRFEERELASDGKAPDPKKGDFLNYIYSFYDSSIDVEHPSNGFVNVNLDVQRYYAPLFSGNMGDEVLKLHKSFDAAQKRLDTQLKGLGAGHGKR